MKPELQTLSKSDVERILGQPIHSFSTSAGAKKGDNVAGDLLALEIIQSPGSPPLHLVYKGFPAIGNEERRQFVTQFGIFHTETCMYEKIFPRVEALLKKRPNVKRRDLPFAKYISGFNDDQNDYVCLEDLRPQGFKMPDKFKSLSKAEVTLVMKEMARFHALTYFLIRYDGERMFEDDKRIHRIKYNAFTMDNPMMSGMFSRMLSVHLENTVELLEPRNKELAGHVRKFLEKHDCNSLYRFHRFKFDRTDKAIFPCIVFGDAWSNNILFKYKKDDPNTPLEVKFIDFQLSRRGNIYEDLGYFMWTSTTPSFRKAHLDEVLQTYYSSFQQTMDELDYPMPQGFSKGSFMDGFYDSMLPAYLYMPFALGLQMGDLEYLDDPEENGNSKADNVNNNGHNNNDKANGSIGKNGNSSSSPSPPESPTPPFPDLDKMIKTEKKLHKLRMVNSPRALDRLEELTREIVDLKLLK